MDKFETWWEREGQEFLFALNTTTDDDIKLVAEVAWKNGAYCAEQAEQPVSQEYQDHLVNQSFDWAAMAAKHQFMEGYRIGLAEMREKCAKACEEIEQDRWNLYKGRLPYTGAEAGRADPHEQGVSMGAGECAAAIRAINFEGDTGFRPVSEMIAERADGEQWSSDDMAYRPSGLSMEQAEQEPVAWHHPQCEGQCIACLIEETVQDAYGTQGRNYLLRHIKSVPIRTKNLTDEDFEQSEVKSLRQQVAALKAVLDAWNNVEQEPVAEVVLHSHKVGFGRTEERKDIVFLADVEVGTKLYAAPVRTKDLTNSEKLYILGSHIDPITKDVMGLSLIDAAIAADREKNK